MKKNVTFFVMALCLALLMCGKTFAQGMFTPSQSTITLPVTIFVPAGAAEGTVLWTSPTVTSNMKRRSSGGGNPQVYVSTIDSNNAVAYYPTNTPGIGVRWRAKLLAPAYPSGHDLVLGRGRVIGPPAGITDGETEYQQALYFELVKTGPITSSTKLTVPPPSSSSALIRFQYNCASYGCIDWYISIAGTGNVVVGPTCSVRTLDQIVPLRQVTINAFTGPGSTSTPSSFSIDIACTGGVPGSKTNAYVTLTDYTDINNRGNVLTLSGSPKAAGIGVQIKRNGNIVSYGPDSNQIPNTNQWLAGIIGQVAAGETLLRIPFTASYVQTAATASGIVAGPANAKATFNVTYN